MTKAALLGTGALSDAFTVAFMLPNLFRRLFAEGSIAVAFIPAFKEFLINDDHKETKEFLASFWTVLTFIVSSVVAISIIAAPYFIVVFGKEAFDETVLLTRIMFPYLLFISIAAFFQGILNSVYIFVPSALAPIILNLVFITAAWLLSPLTSNPARAMAIGVFAGGFLEAAIQLPFVIKKGFSFCWRGLYKSLCNRGTRKVFKLIGPTIIGMAAYQLNDIVSTALARGAGEGIVSSLQYSLRMQELILGVFAVSIGTVLLPELAEHTNTGNWNAYNKRLLEAISIVSIITIPVIFFSLLQGENLIRLLFQTGEFDESSVALTLKAFKYHIIGLSFIALNRILAPAFYAQNDSFSPTLAGIISFIVNIILAIVLVDRMEGGGIALALSIAGAVNTVFLFLFLRKNKNIIIAKITVHSALYMIKICLFSILSIIPVYLIKNIVERFFTNISIRSKILAFAAPMAVCFVIFSTMGIFLLYITGDKYIRTIINHIRRKRPA